MSDTPPSICRFELLRQQAENLLRHQPSAGGSAPPMNILEMIHELRVHHAEIEIQNEELRQAQQELANLHQQFETLYESAPCGYLTLTAGGIISRINLAGCRLLGGDKSSLLRRTFTRFILPGHQGAFLTARKEFEKTARRQSIEIPLKTKDIPELWVRTEIEADCDGAGNPLNWRLVLVDITEARAREAALQQNELKYRLLFESANDAIFIVGTDTRILAANPRAVRQLGYTRAELTGMTVAQVDSSANAEKIPDRLFRLKESGGLTFETLHIRKDGTTLPVEVSARPITWEGLPAYLSICRDLTERKKAETTIQEALHEKEIMLREIHHRVKNNLQVVSSLLYLQASRVDSQEAQDALVESQQRILTMAMIHEALCKGENFAAIDLSAYIHQLVRHLQDIHDRSAGIRITLDVGRIDLDITQAVPCSLVLNELITNAFKHAFPDGRAGTIHIRIQKTRDRHLELEIRDDGVGFSGDKPQTATLGMMLVRNLVTRQLHGTMNVSTTDGAAFTLRWPLPESPS